MEYFWRRWPADVLIDHTYSTIKRGGWGRPFGEGSAPPDFWAHCPHGNQAPSAECICGIHYCTTDSSAFFQAIRGQQTKAAMQDGGTYALTVGEPLGAVRPSLRPDPAHLWGHAPQSRAAGYRVRGILVDPRPNVSPWAQLNPSWSPPTLPVPPDEVVSALTDIYEKISVPVVAGRLWDSEPRKRLLAAVEGVSVPHGYPRGVPLPPPVSPPLGA